MIDFFYKTKGRDRAKQWLFAALMFVICVPMVMVAHYARPMLDDYNYSAYLHHEIQANGFSLWGVCSSVWQTNITFYRTWQGLYTSVILLPLQPGVWGETYYGFTLLIMLSMIYVTFWLSAKWILKELVLSRTYSPLLLALFLTFFVAQNMPNPLEGLYWYNGAMNYIPFCLLTLLNILLVAKIYVCQSVRQENCLLFVSMLLSFVISGGNHATSFLNLLAMFGLSILYAFVKKYKVCLSFISAGLGFGLMLVAPGTTCRANALGTGNVSIVKSVVMGLFQSFGMTLEWFDWGLVGCLILLTPLCVRIAKDNRFGLSYAWPLLPVLVGWCIMGAMWCIPYYAGMPWFGYGRLYNVVWITFVALVLICYTYFLGWFMGRFSVHAKQSPTKWYLRFVQGGLFALAICGIMLSGKACPHISVYGMSPATSIVACVDLYKGTASGYAQEMDERIARYHDDALDEVAVRPIEHKPYLLYMEDLSEDPEFWSNVSISTYYEKSIYRQAVQLPE